MKALLSIVALFVMTGVAISQTQSTVTVNTTGNRNKQIVVDSKYYTINNTSATDEQAVVITDLASGQHTLQVVRKNQYNKNVATKTIFTLRDGYDLTIAINSDGAVSSFESRIDRWGANTNKPITNAAFNRLITQTKAKASSTSKANFLENEFTTTNKRFTSKQASQLIQLVNSESLRLKLAKQVYPKITDTEKFSLVTNLLKSSSNRAALNDYIASLPDGGNNGTDIITMAPITDEKFRIIYNEANAEPSVNDKSYYLNNFFDKNFNYYTSSQASQLIQLINGEQERFDLAKAAYRGITDRQNYGLVSQLLNSSYNRTALVSYINTFDNNTVRTAMSTADFNSLYQSAYYTNSSASRYSLIQTAFTTAGNYFTVAQAKKIIPLVSNENSRLLLSKEVYKVLVDRANYAQFNEFLTSTTVRNDFSNYVANYDTYGTGTGVAMNETEYKNLYNSINNSWSSSTKVSLATQAFNNNSNYFTVYQVRQLLLLINSENDRLVLAKSSYNNIVDPANYTQLYDVFNTSASKNDLANFIAGVQNGTSTGVAMNETEYKNLYNSINNSWSSSTKVSLATEAFSNNGNYFTVYQVRQLLLLIGSENDRLVLAKSSYDNIVDPANYTQLYDVFNTSASKNDLANFFAGVQNGTGTIVKIPMTETEFNSISRDIQFTFGLGAKMSSLTNVFNKETNFFTVQQAKQLIQMVSAESNRLELAKSSYNNITDPDNFSQMYDIFSSQSVKNELMAYVNSNAYLNR